MTAALLATLLSASSPARAQGESIGVGDMAEALRANESYFKQHESVLKQAGILDPKAGLAGEAAQLDRMEKALADGKPVPGAAQEERAGFGGRGQAALAQLRTTPGAKAGVVGDVTAGPLNARAKTPEEEIGERIDRITERKVQTGVAKQAFKNLLWAAYRADLSRAPTAEVRGLFEFLKKQLTEKEDGTAIWTVHYESDMPPNILATYSGPIAVGPSFAAMAAGGVSQMTVLFHEMLHGFDDGKDGTPIETNRMSGLFAYSPDDPNPALHNASEMLAYTDMAKWASAF